MNFAPWYRREEYALIREIMEDGRESFPLSFDEWERNAESERASAKLEGTIIFPVIMPDEFSYVSLLALGGIGALLLYQELNEWLL